MKSKMEQKAYIVTEKDLKELFNIAQMTKAYGDYKPYTFEEALRIWKLDYDKVTINLEN